VKEAQPSVIYLNEYQAPDYNIHKTHLRFDLYDDYTCVTSELTISRVPGRDTAPLVLHGQELELVSLKVDGKDLQANDYSVDEDGLTIYQPPTSFILNCVTKILPHLNTSLEGLYKSNTMYCTQCEAEGFRKITYYLDRPDVMSEFTTRISANKARYPVLLSNGNKIAQGEEQGERHWVEWHDPFIKPSYLFALVAGDLVNVDDAFTTQSGREVKLQIFVEQKDIGKCSHAMQSLKHAMKWDEDVYGREYDLDIFMIVAVDDFNMGAMENKGLNIFNTSCVLASQDTTTDASFQSVEAIVAHEYFHNWSGNRVTCRDWFQLSLKEGFTVFRDSQFSSDRGSRAVKRVEDVNVLRTFQFAEDAGPMAHPVQPASFIEISNFYTLTVYEKGAEVVRMIHSLLGAELFRKGSDRYFELHDGCAVTIEDFVQAMSDVSGRDFTQFMHWYRQAGTPTVSIQGSYNQDTRTYTLKTSQACSATPENEHKAPFHIPMATALIGQDGPMPLLLKRAAGGQPQKHQNKAFSEVLEITEAEQEFVFEQVDEQPVPSLFRNFSAPVNIEFRYSLSDLQLIMAADDDGFCRWDASQRMAVSVVNEVMHELGNQPAPVVNQYLLNAHGQLLDQALAIAEGRAEGDLHMLAYAITLPSEEYLSQQQSVIDVESTHFSRARIKRKLAQVHYDKYLKLYHCLNENSAFSVDATSIARRKMKNTALSYLASSAKQEAIALCERQVSYANNMTDELSALTEICHSGSPAMTKLKSSSLTRFYSKWQEETLVLNHWFSVQASSPQPTTLSEVKALLQHPAFDANNPNKIRALVGGFCNRNPICFHERKGSGYSFLADQVIALNRKNPQMSARLITPLTRWKKFDDQRQALMKSQLERISDSEGLSKDVFEVVSKSL